MSQPHSSSSQPGLADSSLSHDAITQYMDGLGAKLQLFDLEVEDPHPPTKKRRVSLERWATGHVTTVNEEKRKGKQKHGAIVLLPSFRFPPATSSIPFPNLLERKVDFRERRVWQGRLSAAFGKIVKPKYTFFGGRREHKGSMPGPRTKPLRYVGTMDRWTYFVPRHSLDIGRILLAAYAVLFLSASLLTEGERAYRDAVRDRLLEYANVWMADGQLMVFGSSS